MPSNARKPAPRNPRILKACGETSGLTRKPSRTTVFQPEFRDDLRHWVSADRKVDLRILDLVEATLRDPFAGPGKPEPLRFTLAGCWSRRITQEHRLVYLVTDTQIQFLQARHHY